MGERVRNPRDAHANRRISVNRPTARFARFDTLPTPNTTGFDQGGAMACEELSVEDWASRLTIMAMPLSALYSAWTVGNDSSLGDAVIVGAFGLLLNPVWLIGSWMMPPIKPARTWLTWYLLPLAVSVLVAVVSTLTDDWNGAAQAITVGVVGVLLCLGAAVRMVAIADARQAVVAA